LYEEIFEDDNYAWNPDILNSYMQLLMEKGEYKRAIEAKRKFIAHMLREGTIDH
jgi:hypothetical protein